RVDTGRDEARFQCRFEHVAGNARVLADENCAALGGEHPRSGASQQQRKIHGHRMLADRAADPVRSEVLASQTQLFVSSTARAALMASTVGATSCARTIRAPFM